MIATTPHTLPNRRGNPSHPPSRCPLIRHPKSRQAPTQTTPAFSLTLRAVFVALLFCSCAAGQGFAAVTELTCKVGSPSDLTKTYNAGQLVTIQTTWKNGIPPFAATFKAGGSTIGTANTSQGSADFAIPAANLAEGPNLFAVTVIETSVPNASTVPDVPAPGTVNVDKQPPTITITVSSGNVVSPATGHNEVLISFTSSEPLGEAPKFTVSPGSWNAPAPVSPEAAPFSSNQYKITVPTGTPAGAYTVRAVGRDNTEPAATRNEGAGQVSFAVDAAADGAPTITTCNPPTPFRTESCQLTGSVQAESGSQKIEVLEGTTVVATVDVPANTTTWTTTILNITEGSHGYTARRTDPLGNVSASSAEWKVTSDRTAPARPTLTQPKTPTNQQKIAISGTGVVDPPHNSAPIRVLLMRDGTGVGSTTANADGTFTFAEVSLNTGINAFYAQSADRAHDGTSADPGNQSAFSNPIQVKFDTTPPVVVDGGIIIGQPPSPVLLGTFFLSQDLLTFAAPGAIIGRRHDTLIIADKQTGTSGQPGKADLWPIAVRGLPPAAVLVSYRRIVAPRALHARIRSLLTPLGQARVIELCQLIREESPSPGYIIDLALAKTGRLPIERVDLLIQDISSERVPAFLLPDPDRLPPATPPAIRHAIRFRGLHATPRQGATTGTPIRLPAATPGR